MPAPDPTQRAAPLAAIVGPTGVGKSDLAMALAGRLPVEIVVADSRQVYRGMDIGTAKPSSADRSAVPHHLLDLAQPGERFTVADWVQRARVLLPEIRGRGRLPLIVAGTGLYLRALVDGYDFGGRPDSGAVRESLRADLRASGLHELAARLVARDPGGASRMDLRNPRRVLRALELTELAGEPIRPGQQPYPGPLAMVGVMRPRDALTARIAARTERMFAMGLVEEVASLRDGGLDLRTAPLGSHGYREAARLLAGEWDRATAVAATVRRTRQYAKRQMTWFRAERRIVWIDAGSLEADEPAIVDRAVELIRRLLDA